MNGRSNVRVGVFVDNSNIYMNGGNGMRYDVLRDFACRDGAEAVRLNTYVSYDDQRAEKDADYRSRQQHFFSILRDFGFKVIVKNVKWYQDEEGSRYGKANADLDLAVDALLQSENIDRVVFVTGDGDFVQVIRALQNRGCRVEGIGFNNVSGELRREADLFISGFLIPNLLPIRESRSDPAWGEDGSIVRGSYFSRPPQQPFGFLRFVKMGATDLGRTNPRQKDSSYDQAFCHDSQLPVGIVIGDPPDRQVVYEFQLQKSEKGFNARNVKVL